MYVALLEANYLYDEITCKANAKMHNLHYSLNMLKLKYFNLAKDKLICHKSQSLLRMKIIEDRSWHPDGLVDNIVIVVIAASTTPLLFFQKRTGEYKQFVVTCTSNHK